MKIASIIATKDRTSFLKRRALFSVGRQKKMPDYLIVIDDSLQEQCLTANKLLLESFKKDFAKVNVTYMKNEKDHGASSCWNLGIDCLLNKVMCVEDCFVAILDDDDFWKPEYLMMCQEKVERENLDMVASSFFRVENKKVRSYKVLPSN